MSNAYFPVLSGVTWNVIKRPVFATKIAQYVSGKEIRVSNYAYPVWEWEMSYEFLRADSHAELQTLMGFFLARQGSYDSFLWVDPSEANTVVSQSLGIGDASNITFILTKIYGGFLEPIGYALPASFHVYFTVGMVTTEQLSGWTLSSNQVVFTVAPAVGTIVTASYTWYYQVRFGEDMQDYSNFMYQLWELKKLTLHSVKI